MSPAQKSVDLVMEHEQPNSREILPNEIAGVYSYLISIPSGQSADITSGRARQAVSCVVGGAGTFTSSRDSFHAERRDLFIAQPGEQATFHADKDSFVLRIEMDLHPEEIANPPANLYPFAKSYEACEHYRDYFKSDKTISRTLVPPFTLPRFSMGSVETCGPDRVEPHAHPVLDQLFFSFSENDCTLLINGARFHFGGNCLLHIPLGSDHGIDAKPGDTVQYLWIDFFQKSDDMQYLVDTHIPVEK
jgi:hypothetical protein